MNELVHIKKNDVFTDSLIVAKNTNISHRRLKDQIRKYQTQIESFGLLGAYQTESTGGRPEEFYELNEQQATFLITLLKNTPKVIEFKIALVKEFYRMRQFILQRSNEEWQQARRRSKITRNAETDVLKEFIEYAKLNGSHNADKYYILFSSLVNNAVGIESGKRDQASPKVLATIELLEDLILHEIEKQVKEDIFYKTIYQNCKSQVSEVMKFIYLPAQRLLLTGTG